MPAESEGEDDRAFIAVKKRKKKDHTVETDLASGSSEDKYIPFFKPNYKRLYPDNSNHTEYSVFLESTNEEKLGNKDPISIQKIIGKYVKGQYEMSRANAQKLKITFKLSTDANDFLCNEESLAKCNIRAFIPSSFVEKVGVIQHVSTELSNEELYRKLSGEFEIVAVRRFMKKNEDRLEPLKTVTVTFVTGVLPQCIYLDHWRIPVSMYVPPVMQCYKCLKFNHSAKICKNAQVCSMCSGGHSYKDCNNKETDFKCSNCGGAHLAISKTCPVKMERIAKQKQSYANVAKNLNFNLNFPAIQKSQQRIPSIPVNAITNVNNKPPQTKNSEISTKTQKA